MSRARYRGKDVSDFQDIYETTGLLTLSAVTGTLVTLSSMGMVERRLITLKDNGSYSLNDASEEAAWSVTAWGLQALEYAKQSGT